MYILASMERSIKFRLNDKRLFLTHSILIENAEFAAQKAQESACQIPIA